MNVITRSELRQLAKARLKESKTLFNAKQYDTAVYLSGYAVELALKARICKTLKWSEFPPNGKEFKGFHAFKTHDLEVLLILSGIGEKIINHYSTEWSIVSRWNPENRYKTLGSESKQTALDMIKAVEELLKAL
jgi:HEPN domain-containing protein